MIDLVQYRRSRGNTEGVGWAIVAAAMLTLMTFAVRQSTRELHVLQVVFVRNALALLLMAPWMPSTELRSVTTRIRPFLPRAICEAATITLWFSALSLVPLTEAVALSFSLPLFATLAARLFLGETVGWKRWLAVSAGFAGVLLVLQPGRQSFAPTALLVLLSSATAAVSNILVKRLTTVESAKTIVFYVALFLTPLSLPPAVITWRNSSPVGLLWAALTAVFATAAQFSIARSLAVADVSFVMPWRYTQLVLTGLVGYFIFDEVFGITSVCGFIIITASAVSLALIPAADAR